MASVTAKELGKSACGPSYATAQLDRRHMLPCVPHCGAERLSMLARQGDRSILKLARELWLNDPQRSTAT